MPEIQPNPQTQIKGILVGRTEISLKKMILGQFLPKKKKKEWINK